MDTFVYLVLWASYTFGPRTSYIRTKTQNQEIIHKNNGDQSTATTAKDSEEGEEVSGGRPKVNEADCIHERHSLRKVLDATLDIRQLSFNADALVTE
jgi:hypothetical protein